jgi:hypothetical protein
MIGLAIAAGAGLGIATVAGALWVWELIQLIRSGPEGTKRGSESPLRPYIEPGSGQSAERVPD